MSVIINNYGQQPSWVCLYKSERFINFCYVNIKIKENFDSEIKRR